MASYDVYSGDKSILAAKINSTQTSAITIAAMNINGSSTAWANTGVGVIEISEEIEGTLKREWISYTSASADSNNVTTLAGVSRDVSRTASTLTGSGTGQSFNKGASVKFVNFHYIYNQKADVDRVNTWTAAQTFGTAGEVLFSGTDVAGMVVKSLTSTQRDALASVSNGAVIYNSTLGQIQYREGGAWVTNASGGSLADGSTTVAGKFEEATVAEQGTATATGATGARLIPAVANLVKTSSGASDENKIAILNASGVHAANFSGTGTADSTKYLRGDLAWTTLASAIPAVSLVTYYKRAATSAYSTTSTSFADIDATNVKSTVTTTANTILVLLLTSTARSSNANTTNSFDIVVDGTRVGDATYGLLSFEQEVANKTIPLTFLYIWKPGALTAKDIKVQWKTSANTLDMGAGSDTTYALLKLEP